MSTEERVRRLMTRFKLSQADAEKIIAKRHVSSDEVNAAIEKAGQAAFDARVEAIAETFSVSKVAAMEVAAQLV